MLGEQDVPHGVSTGDGGETAGLRLAQAHQAEQVAGIGVELELMTGLVATHVQGLIVLALVEYVTELVPGGVLRDPLAEMLAKAPDDHRRLGVAVFRDRQPAHDVEATAGANLAPHSPGKFGCKRGQRKVIAGHVVKRGADAAEVHHCGVDLIDPAWLKFEQPGGVGFDVSAHPCTAASDQLHGRLLVFHIMEYRSVMRKVYGYALGGSSTGQMSA